MKRIVSIICLLILMIQLSACSFGNSEVFISKDLLCSCEENIVHRYDWEDDRYQIYAMYPGAYYMRVAENVLDFDTVSSFANAIRKKTITESQLEILQKAAQKAEHTTHGEKIALPVLETIRTLCYDQKPLSLTVKWFGCNDYALEGKIEIERKEIPLCLRYYGFENFNDQDFPNSNNLKRIETFYDFSKGDIRYRICERELYQEKNGENQLVTRLYDVELEQNGDYYYLMMGFPKEGYDCPKLNLDFISRFTLESVK